MSSKINSEIVTFVFAGNLYLQSKKMKNILYTLCLLSCIQLLGQSKIDYLKKSEKEIAENMILNRLRFRLGSWTATMMGLSTLIGV